MSDSNSCPSARHPRLIDFDAINAAAVASLQELVERWLPDGHVEGREYMARNPTRADHDPGSFSINLHSGLWSDFATGDKGGDPIGFYAYLKDLDRVDAARDLAHELRALAGHCIEQHIDPGRLDQLRALDEKERNQLRIFHQIANLVRP